MLAFFLALRDAADWTAQQIQAAMSLMFGSALVLAFTNALVLCITGSWLGKFMNPAVAIISCTWIIATLVAFHMNTGLLTKTALIAYRETRRFMMGFVIVESSTGLFFYLVPLPLIFIFGLLLAISIWYFSSKMMDHPFDWNNFRVPAIWATAIIIIVGLAISLGFLGHGDIKDPSQVGPKVKTDVQAAAGAIATATKSVASSVASAATPAEEKPAKKNGKGFSYNPEAKIPHSKLYPQSTGIQEPSSFPLGNDGKLKPVHLKNRGDYIFAKIDAPAPPAWVRWVIKDNNGVKYLPIYWPKGDMTQTWTKTLPDTREYDIHIEIAPLSGLGRWECSFEKFESKTLPLS